MTEKEFYMELGKLRELGLEDMVDVISQMVDLLDTTNADDYFGTEGWERHIFWD